MAKNIVGLNDNNVLSMDYVVNSKGTKLIDVIYPVGSIYMSFNSTSPATLFGGTWVQITDRFLYCANSSGTTGGENSHTLGLKEMPVHTHVVNINGNGNDAWKDSYGHMVSLPAGSGSENGYAVVNTSLLWTANAKTVVRTDADGGSQPHNNMPQYITCYAWHRTA